MNVKAILFPTDFSDYNDAALDVASSLAAESNATLHILHVHDMQDLNAVAGEASVLYAWSWEESLKAARERLKEVRPTVPAVAYEHHCLNGTPVMEITSFADENKIDLIVMASHGRTGFSRLLMGSIAEGVLRKAGCPVLIVKQPAAKAKTDQRLATHHA